MVFPWNVSGLIAPFRTRYAARVHLFAAFLGGELADGRMGEDHEVVFVVADDVAVGPPGGQGRNGAATAAHTSTPSPGST